MSAELTTPTTNGSVPSNSQPTTFTPDPSVTGKLTKDATPTRAPHVIIFVPGLGHASANSAERVADLFAGALDRRLQGSFAARKTTATAPRGLRAASTIFGPEDSTPAYEVFELDYQRKLTTLGEDADVNAVATGPGFLRSCWFAAHGLRKVTTAWRKPAKSKSAKWQLVVGSAMAASLLFFAVASVAAALYAAFGQVLPGSLSLSAETSKYLGASSASILALVGAVWAFARPRIVAAAVRTSQLIDYLEGQRDRETITRTLDDAVDGLRDAGWDAAELSIVAYSFGSIVTLDALYPSPGQPLMRYDGFLRRLVTIGTSADMIRTYYPSYFAGRQPQVSGLSWTNVYIPADVFGSAFTEESRPDLSPTTSVAYTDEQLSLGAVLGFRGFSTHGGYWNGADEGSCFDLVLQKAFTTPAIQTAA